MMVVKSKRHLLREGDQSLSAFLVALLDEEDYISLGDALEFAHLAISKDNEPNSLHEAQKRPPNEWAAWHEAAVKEIQALVENGTFKLVQLPPGHRAIGSRWVFKVKRNPDGSIERYKARLVAKGYNQRPGFDFTESE
jgi:hypothetical protein